jgi:hypothetical protein
VKVIFGRQTVFFPTQCGKPVTVAAHKLRRTSKIARVNEAVPSIGFAMGVISCPNGRCDLAQIFDSVPAATASFVACDGANGLQVGPLH